MFSGDSSSYYIQPITSNTIPPPPSHSINHQYIYAPCSGCKKSHYHEYTVVSGFLLKFVDHMCPHNSQNSTNTESFMQYTNYQNQPEAEQQKYEKSSSNYEGEFVEKPKVPEKEKDYIPIRLNGLDPSDMNIRGHKLTQCCTVCLKLQRECPVCSGKVSFRPKETTPDDSEDVSYKSIISNKKDAGVEADSSALSITSEEPEKWEETDATYSIKNVKEENNDTECEVLFDKKEDIPTDSGNENVDDESIRFKQIESANDVKQTSDCDKEIEDKIVDDKSKKPNASDKKKCKTCCIMCGTSLDVA